MYNNSAQEKLAQNSTKVSKNEDSSDISMKIESRDSKKVMNTLLNDLLDRKSTNRLSKNHIEESKISGVQGASKNQSNYEENKESAHYNKRENSRNKKAFNNTAEINSGENPTLSQIENRFKRKKNDKQSIKGDQDSNVTFDPSNMSHKQVVYIEEEDLSKIKFKAKSPHQNNKDNKKGGDAVSEIGSINTNIENTLYRQKFSQLKIDNKIIDVHIEAMHKNKESEKEIPLEERGCCAKSCTIF